MMTDYGDILPWTGKFERLSAENDALRARVAELEGVQRDLVSSLHVAAEGQQSPLDLVADLRHLRSDNARLREQWASVPWEAIRVVSQFASAWAAQAEDVPLFWYDYAEIKAWLAAHAPKEVQP